MALFVLALAVRLVFLGLSDNDDFDAFLRLALSRSAAEHGTWSPAAFWLPGHFWILSLPYRAGLASPFWPRLLTALAGAATVPVVVRVVRRWGGGAAAAGAGVLLALNPLHVRLSVLTVAEPFFYLFASVGLWLFTAYVEAGGVATLLVGAAAFGLATALRMEAWLLVALLPVLALFRPRPHADPGAWARAVAFTTLAGAFPVGWGLHLFARYGDFFYVASFNAARIAAARIGTNGHPGASVGWSLLVWPVVVFGAMGPVAGWLACRGTVRRLREGPDRLPALLLVVALVAATALAASARIEPTARYGFVLVWLLLLGLGPGAGLLARPRAAAAVAAGWLLVVWGLGGSPALAPISPAPRFAADIDAVGGFLRREAKAETLVLGPLRDDAWRWSVGLDAWRPRGPVHSVRSADQAAEVIGREPSGVWVVEADAPGVASLTAAWPPAWSAGRYAVYRW